MVELSKPLLKDIILKNLEYQDYNNYLTIFITIITSSVALLISILLFFWSTLAKNPVWIVVIIQVFIGFEIIFFILLFYSNRQKQKRRKDIEQL